MEKDNILSESTNQSSNHLNKIADYLYKNTLYDRNLDAIVSPVFVRGVAIRSSMDFTLYHNFLGELKDYLEEIFGLGTDEAERVWNYYRNKIREYDNNENSYHITDEFKDSKDVNRLDESTNQRKLVEKIAQEIINSTVIDADREQLYFLPPVYSSDTRHAPIHLDVFSEWIHNDKSMGRHHLEQDIRKMGRQYIKKILGFGITQADDPIYKEINDKVIKNVLHRALNWEGSDNQTFNLNESTREEKSKNYREKVYRDLVKKTKWRDDSYREIDVDGVCNKINSYIEWGSSGAYFYVIPPCIEDLLTNVYGLTYSEMDRFFWEWYGEHIIYMLISKKEYLPPHIKRLNLSYLNESVDSVEKNKPYLDKVVDKLKHYTTFIKQTAFNGWTNFYIAKVPFTGGNNWVIEWFGKNIESGFGFKDSFKKEMEDVYGLNPLEREYVYMKFTSYLINEFKRLDKTLKKRHT